MVSKRRPTQQHPSTQGYVPIPLAGGSSFWLFGQWLCITNAKAKRGWVLTMHEWDGTQWVKWFDVPHIHFATGWAQCKNRARKAMLEGARPKLEASCPELKALADYYREHGRHALMLDNPHHDHYGLDAT